MSRPTPEQRRKILFVCMGNICRSPLAEGVFIAKMNKRGVAAYFTVDSAGTGGWHVGEAPDPRVQAVAKKQGVKLISRARQLEPRDFDRFDLFICMDEDNRSDVLKLGVPEEKVSLLLTYDAEAPRQELPDPFYGGADEFKTVYELIDGACDALLQRLLDEVGHEDDEPSDP